MSKRIVIEYWQKFNNMNANNWSDIIPHKSQQQQQDADPGSDKEMHPDSITQHTDSGNFTSTEIWL